MVSKQYVVGGGKLAEWQRDVRAKSSRDFCSTVLYHITGVVADLTI
jgi:hypothetical protein